MNKFFLRYVKFILLVAIPFSGSASIEDYFAGASKRFPFSRYKEVLFSLKSQKAGVFGVSDVVSFYKMYIKVNEQDSIEYLIQEFSDSSFLDGRGTRYFYSQEIENSLGKSFYDSILSSLFFGRTIELYHLDPENFEASKSLKDYLVNDPVEILTRETERKNFNQLNDIKKAIENTQETVQDDDTLNLLSEYLFSKRTTNLNFFKEKDTGEMLEMKLSKLYKKLSFNGGYITFETKTKDFKEVKYMNYLASVDLESVFIANTYAKHIVFKNDEKETLMTVLQVNNSRRKSINLQKVSLNLEQKGLGKFNLFDSIL